MANQLENIAGLQSILETVNSLPDAGSGGGGSTPETCTVNVYWGASDGANPQYTTDGIPAIAYCDADGVLNTVSAKMVFPLNPNWSVDLTCMCGSLLCFTQGLKSSQGIASVSVSQEITNLVTLPVHPSGSMTGTTDVVCLLPKTAGTYAINVYYG